jgi:hypothetical protein
MRKTLKALLIPVLASAAGAAIAGAAKADGSMSYYYYQAPMTNYYYDPPATTYYYYSPPTTQYYYIERPMRCHLGVCY